MEDQIKRYSNGDITVVWKPSQCIHSGICFRGLGKVFDPRRKPWIVLDHATSDQIVEQIEKCPSGALSYHLNTEQSGTDATRQVM